MKKLINLLIGLSFISPAFTQKLELTTSQLDSCSQVLTPTIVVKCVFDKKLGWHQEATIETEQFVNDCPIDSIHLLVFDTLGGAKDTVFNLFSNQIQINSYKDNCWFPQFSPGKLFIYSHGEIISTDTLTVQISILEISKKCGCGIGNNGSGQFVFDKASLAFDENRRKATKLRLKKKKYSSEFIEYNYEKGKQVKVDMLSKNKGTIYIDESHISTGFSRNNKFPEAAYKVIVNSKERDLIILGAECRRADGDLMIWKVVIQSGKIEVTTFWYSSGELKTKYVVKSK